MIGVKSRAFNGGRGGAGSALRAAPSGTPAAPRPPSARHRPTIRCLRQSLWLKPALPANPLTTNYQFCRIPSLTTRGTLTVSHFRGRVQFCGESGSWPRAVARRGVLEPTGAREHVRGPGVISTATVKGAREGARVEIMSVGCPRTAGRASRSGQDPGSRLCQQLGSTVRNRTRAFDKGLITLDEDLRVVLSSSIRDALSHQSYSDHFSKFEGRQIRLPARARPAPVFLDYHRDYVFIR